ncbi:MAG TPA: GNAT family N-acetyltransferase [Xanthobacteraceae bacterium]|nr:GNAT family N-acetyltransferase [Xanthobacteraceae bacterium]
MSNISLRAATPSDIPAITRIYAHAVANGTASFELEPPDEAEMARRQRVLLDAGYPYLVAEGGSAIAGYAYAGPYRARPAYHWCVENSVYVAPEFHRRGIGKLLLLRLIEETERRGYRQMIAVIGDSSQTASIALHYAAGFAMIGTLRSVGFKHGKWLDTPLMQRPLGKGDTEPPEKTS